MAKKRADIISDLPILKMLYQMKLQVDQAGLNTYQLRNQAAVTNTCMLDGREYLMFGAYNYSGLNNHPRINEAAKKAIDRYGTGTCGVWLLTGWTELHEELEATLARFTNKDHVTIFNSGYNTNESFIPTFYGHADSSSRDLVLFDNYAHNSLQTGIRAARAVGACTVKFVHNNMDDLEEKLKAHLEYPRKLIVVDSVYSMDGDICPIERLLELCEQYNANIMADEAHAIGVIGPRGRGIQDMYDLGRDDIDVLMGTLSKSIPSNGGFIATNNPELHFYLQYASPMRVFTAAMTPANTAAALEGIKVLEEEGEDIVKRLKARIDRFVDAMVGAGFNLIDAPQYRTAVIPIFVGDEDKSLIFSRYALDQGIVAPAVRFPAVPFGKARIRVCIQAGHTPEQIDRAVEVFIQAGKKTGII